MTQRDRINLVPDAAPKEVQRTRPICRSAFAKIPWDRALCARAGVGRRRRVGAELRNADLCSRCKLQQYEPRRHEGFLDNVLLKPVDRVDPGEARFVNHQAVKDNVDGSGHDVDGCGGGSSSAESRRIHNRSARCDYIR
jgi:hypothetical protein